MGLYIDLLWTEQSLVTHLLLWTVPEMSFDRNTKISRSMLCPQDWPSRRWSSARVCGASTRSLSPRLSVATETLYRWPSFWLYMTALASRTLWSSTSLWFMFLSILDTTMWVWGPVRRRGGNTGHTSIMCPQNQNRFNSSSRGGRGSFNSRGRGGGGSHSDRSGGWRDSRGRGQRGRGWGGGRGRGRIQLWASLIVIFTS